MRIGTYRVTVTAAGFSKAEVGPFTLDVQQRAAAHGCRSTARFGHPDGDGEANGALYRRATRLIASQVIDSTTMQTLALNGRNPVQLAQLTVGVTVSEPGARDENGYGFSANGARSLENNFLLDGVDNNSNLPDLLNEANYVVMPSVDALEEFRVATNSYGAELGRANGAVVNATVKRRHQTVSSRAVGV